MNVIMSHGTADDFLEIELQVELDLMCEDDTIQAIDVMEIDDIFSSCEGDYKLFALDASDCTHEDDLENQTIWGSYFDKIAMEQQKYLHQSQNALSEMKQTCADTLKLCTENTIHVEPEEKQPEVITIEPIMTPQTTPDLLETTDEIITTNPCIPCYVLSTPPSSPIQCQFTMSPSITNTHCQSMNDDNYNTKLQKLENELKQVTQSHHEEKHSCTSVKWSTLLHQSKELYDEYMETTHTIQRDQDKWTMIKYFSDWKVVTKRNKRHRLHLIKLTHDMECIVHGLIDKAVNTSRTLSIWSALVLQYKHKMVMNRIRCNASWKSCVVDYVMFHYTQTYASTMNHRHYFKLHCVPLISTAATSYSNRRIFEKSAIKISLWYKHKNNKRKLMGNARGIYKLCVFRNKYIDNPLLIMKHVFMPWIRYIKWKQHVLGSIRNTLMKHAKHEAIRHWRDTAQYHALKRTIVCLRRTKRQRIRYLKHNAAVGIQSYFRMFHIRSITNEVQSKLSQINDIFALDTYREDEFKTLDATEYILDEGIMEWELKPLSNPPSPHVECKSMQLSDDESSAGSNDSSSCGESENDTECPSDDESQRDANVESDAELHETDEDAAKSWRKRKKKYKRMKKVNRWNRRKSVCRGFGGSNRFKTNKKKKRNKKPKPKLVKFGCP
eukprot:18116_1